MLVAPLAHIDAIDRVELGQSASAATLRITKNKPRPARATNSTRSATSDQRSHHGRFSRFVSSSRSLDTAAPLDGSTIARTVAGRCASPHARPAPPSSPPAAE